MSVAASQAMCSTTLVVPHANGLHLRPAALLMKEACRFDADIWVAYGDRKANAKSLMNIVMLCAAQGAEVAVLAEGYDAHEAIEAIEDLFVRLQDEEAAAETETTNGSSMSHLVSQFSQQASQIGHHLCDIKRRAVRTMSRKQSRNVEATAQNRPMEEEMTVTSKTVKAPKRATGKSEKKVHFELAAPSGSEVFVAGTFNDWNPTQYQLHDNPNEGLFAASIPLPRGRHEYKFIVNGRWCSDPKCSDSVPNPCGSLNSVIEV